MRMLSFANRNRKEILRDPLSLIFGIGFPLILLLLMTWLKKSLPDMPTELFALSAFAPGMVMFGQSFISMFLGILMAGDRSGSFLMRLFASPMRCIDYIGGYALPLIPIAAAQSALCFTAAVLLGLPVSVHILPAVLLSVLNSLLFIALGLLIGSVLQNSQQVGGIGSVLVNVAAWLSGVWFPLDQIGGGFAAVCKALPFYHAVESVSLVLAGDYGAVWPHLLVLLLYTTLFAAAAVFLFYRRMRQ